MPQIDTAKDTKPAVLENRYPVYDPGGNRCQFVRLRFICDHEEQFYSLDLGRMAGYKWKPLSNRQLMDEHLRITCPIAWKLCRACSQVEAEFARQGIDPTYEAAYADVGGGDS